VETKFLDNEILDRAKSISKGLADRAYEADQAKKLSQQSVDAVIDTGLLAMTLPKFFGGTEANFVTRYEVFKHLGSACAATSWCVGNHGAACGRLYSLMGEKSSPYLKDVSENGAVISQGVVPSGEIIKSSDGFRLSGRWQFLSFSLFAKWVLLCTKLPTDSEIPKIGYVILPIDLPGLEIQDTWHTMSLRASMSNDLLADNVVIEEDWIMENKPAVPGAKMPVGLRAPGGGFSLGPAATVLGVAEAAIAETIKIANATNVSTMNADPVKRSEKIGNQFVIADSVTELESAKAFLSQELINFTYEIYNGIPHAEDRIIKLKMAGNLARENAQSSVERLFKIRGANGLYETNSFERYYRDVRIGTLPSPSNPDMIREQIGRHMFGIK
jgi:alkylation response protein AidB-like acyl-CoA dehydrogenase